MSVGVSLASTRTIQLCAEGDPPICPLAQHMCKAVFPLLSLASTMASSPKWLMYACTSSSSPYRHERRNSSDSSALGFVEGIFAVIPNSVVVYSGA